MRDEGFEVWVQELGERDSCPQFLGASSAACEGEIDKGARPARPPFRSFLGASAAARQRKVVILILRPKDFS